MKNRLRCLALTVDEEEPGEFYWRLLESVGDPVVYEAIARSSSAFIAYDIALAAGYGALQRVAGADLEHGPRSRTEDENADPVGSALEGSDAVRLGASSEKTKFAAARRSLGG